MVIFYKNERADDCDIDSDGEHFEFDITRQFIGASCEDEEIWQLSLTFNVSA